jgi:phosphatidylethanolamine-binding protein (PEBP) family uncharacterized protein
MSDMVVKFALGLLMILVSSGYASAMDVKFEWGPTKDCFDPNSPPFEVSDVPTGTKTLSFRMIDLQVPDYPHGGGAVAYAGSGSIPYGAFEYKGPCPPSPHTYEFTVKALDASGGVLATATAQRRFP